MTNPAAMLVVHDRKTKDVVPKDEGFVMPAGNDEMMTGVMPDAKNPLG